MTLQTTEIEFIIEKGWQPIACAPRDGTRIFVCNTHDDIISVAMWCSDEQASGWSSFHWDEIFLDPHGPLEAKLANRDQDFEFWMPMPQLPRQEQLCRSQHLFMRPKQVMRITTSVAGTVQTKEPMLEQALNLVLNERRRQLYVMGFDAENDARYQEGELARAAACYASYNHAGGARGKPRLWPWRKEYWKPKDYLTNLVRAGALIVAEIERVTAWRAKSANRDG